MPKLYGLEDELYDIIESAEDLVDQDVDDEEDAMHDLEHDDDGMMIDFIDGDETEDDLLESANPYYVY